MTPERLAHVRAVYARVLAEWVTDRAPILPLLGTPEDAGRCRQGGHPLATRKDGRHFCPTCAAEKQRERRKES